MVSLVRSPLARRKERGRSLMNPPRKKVLKKSPQIRVLSATIAMIGGGHIRRDCPGFKAWLAKKGNDDVIFFLHESFFTYFSRDTC
jgi:hypothetical protein